MIEVETTELFDRLRELRGDIAPLGERLVAALLADPNAADAIGMAFYGVTIVQS